MTMAVISRHNEAIKYTVLVLNSIAVKR